MINWRKVGMTSVIMALTTRATRAQWRIQREATSREQADLIKCVVVRIESATRLHEVGIASNRGSEYGEYVPGLVHTARHTMEGCKEVGSLTFGRALPLCDS